jgi:hypothetical protein
MLLFFGYKPFVFKGSNLMQPLKKSSPVPPELKDKIIEVTNEHSHTRTES